MTELSTLARGIQRRWWLIATLGLLGGVAAVTASAATTPVYQARTSILVGETLHGAQVDTSALKASQQVAQSYADIITRRPVMEGVVETVELRTTWQQLAQRVRAELPADDPQLIVVTVEANSPREAEAVAGAVGDQLLALSSSRAAAERREFVAGQLTALRQRIEATDGRIADLQKQRDVAKTPEIRQRLQDQIDDQEKMLQDWQKNYADLAALKPADSASTSVEILEKAHASPNPVAPQTNQNVLLAVTLGFMVAIPIAYALETRRGRDEEAGPPATAAETSVTTLHEPAEPTGAVFSAREASRACGVSLSTIRRRCRDGTFEQAYREHCMWRIPVTDLLDAGLLVDIGREPEPVESVGEVDGHADHTPAPEPKPAPAPRVPPDASPATGSELKAYQRLGERA